MPRRTLTNGQTVNDVRLEQRALRHGWAIPESVEVALMDRLEQAATDPLLKIRTAMGMVKTLATVKRTNIEAERLELDRAKFERDSKADAQPATFVVPDVDKIGEDAGDR